MHELQDSFPHAVLNGGDSSFEELVATVVGFIEARRHRALSLPFDIRGTAFQQRVWQALREIPPGQTKSYINIARSIGASASARAVAGACAANKLAVAIPCHRVVRKMAIWGVTAGAWSASASCSEMSWTPRLGRGRCFRIEYLNSEQRARLRKSPAQGIAPRVGALDWGGIAEELDAQGCAVIEKLLVPQECEALTKLYL